MILFSYFSRLNKKQLFIKGSELDAEIKFYFGWLLWLEPLLHWFLPLIERVLLLDQVSRHYYRAEPQIVIANNLKLVPDLVVLNLDQLETKSNLELTFISLAIRHLLKIYSLHLNSKNSADYEAHRLLTQRLETIIEIVNQRLTVRQSTQLTSNYLNKQLNLIQAVHSKNKLELRNYRYIAHNYRVWQQAPAWLLKAESDRSTMLRQSAINRSAIDQWSLNYLDSQPALQVIKVFEAIIENQSESPIQFQVMCSGGIDSMTLVRIFNGLRLTRKWTNVNFGVIHINWHKRNESPVEAMAIADVCRLIGLDYRIYQSPIRPDDPNWENLSTDFRFQSLREFQTELNQIHLGIQVYFCLGHIANDLVENLICNSCLEGSSTGKQTYFDLFGMQELVKYRGVNLLRPLLLHPKPDDPETPCLRDNAFQLDIKRRIVRRAIQDLDYDLSRVQKLYHQALELRQRYRNLPIFQSGPNRYYFNYQRTWALAEWEEIMVGITDRLGWSCLKKKVIKEIYQKVEQDRSQVMIRGDFQITFKPNNSLKIKFLSEA